MLEAGKHFESQLLQVRCARNRARGRNDEARQLVAVNDDHLLELLRLALVDAKKKLAV